MPSWDPQHYLAYAGERGRPFVDLLAQVGADSPGSVVDLGCGPGNMTRLLAERWPGATVTGIDSSAAMIERARADVPALAWVEADLRAWDGEADVVVSNAALQWVDGHLELLPGLADRAREWFAFQVPGNFDAPSHTIPDALARTSRYTEHTGGGITERLGSHDPEVYADALLAGGAWDVNAWETTYLHLLHGEDAVLDWISGTGLRPILDALPEGPREEYVAQLRPLLREAYPVRHGVVAMPFRRVFVVARRR